MSTLTLAFPWHRAAVRPLELRIDVSRPGSMAGPDLDALQRRLRRPGAPRLRPLAIDAGHPGLAFRHREADGEHYVYVEDVASGRLVGCTVFNRLVEVDRRADRHLRSPHSRYDPSWQRRGLAGAVYRWALDAGMNLVSGARQSAGAHALWRSLGRDRDLHLVEVRGKRLRYLGRETGREIRDDLHSRMLLLGTGWTIESLACRCGMLSA